MGSDLRYNLINSFRSIDNWRANIIFNMFGSVTPGFQRRDINLGVKSGDVTLSAGEAATRDRGSRANATASNSELVINGYRIAPVQVKPTREQGSQASPTHLSIMGDGFFAVAESLTPGARVFFTRDGSFQWKQTGQVKVGSGGRVDNQFHLVNAQGLFVLRAGDIDFDATTGTTKLKTPPKNPDGSTDPVGMYMSTFDERDGVFQDAAKSTPGRIRGLLGESVGGQLTTVDDATIQKKFFGNFPDHDSDLAIVKIPGAANMVASSYGGEIYEAPLTARRGIVLDSVRGWFKTEGTGAPHVLPMSLEFQDAQAMVRQLEVESETANFVYKNLSTFLQDYNKGIDDLLGIVR